MDKDTIQVERRCHLALLEQVISDEDALREAAVWLRDGAPGRALEVVERALNKRVAVVRKTPFDPAGN